MCLFHCFHASFCWHFAVGVAERCLTLAHICETLMIHNESGSGAHSSQGRRGALQIYCRWSKVSESSFIHPQHVTVASLFCRSLTNYELLTWLQSPCAFRGVSVEASHTPGLPLIPHFSHSRETHLLVHTSIVIPTSLFSGSLLSLSRLSVASTPCR